MPELTAEAIALGRDERLRAILRDICAATGMGFAAVARVTEHRWIACQVADRIDFGLDPGDELKIHETICDEIRASGEAVVIDDASDDIKWSRHPVPVIYGFKSYCSFPVYLDDGSFFGTLCAIDPAPRQVTDVAIVEMFSTYAKAVGAILSEVLSRPRPNGKKRNAFSIRRDSDLRAPSRSPQPQQRRIQRLQEPRPVGLGERCRAADRAGYTGSRVLGAGSGVSAASGSPASGATGTAMPAAASCSR